MRKPLRKGSVSGKSTCTDCLLRQLCPGYTDREIDRLAGAIVQRRRILERGAALYRAGDVFSTVYVVHTGALKGYEVNGAGRERISAFFLPGELVGLDGFHKGVYTCHTAALVDATVCELDLTRIERQSDKQWEFVRVMSKVVSDQKRRLAVGRLEPQARAAELLRDIAARLTLDAEKLRASDLPMSPEDLASYADVDAGSVDQAFEELARQRPD
ncbi:MAG: cyclic nucleotide-binding domain-containing protein [Gammaproteobacteria bacterium]